jgi:chromosome segregation ATPase
VLVIGCDGLKKRFSAQCTKADKIKSYADGLKEQLQLLERSLDGSVQRHEELKERQRKHFMRLLQVMRKLEVLRAKGISLTPVETRYREKVEELTSAIMVPYEKIQSLESSQAILERQSEAFALSSSVGEADMEELCAVLAKQRDGLKHLTDIVRKDARDISIMERIISGGR